MKKAFSAEQTSLDTRSSTVELRTSSEVCTTVYIQLGKKNPLRKWRLNGYMWSREKIKKGGFLGTLIKSQIMLLASSRLFSPSVRMEQFSSNWKDFQEIWYLSIFSQSLIKI